MFKKIISTVLVAFFLLGGAITVLPGRVYAAAAAPAVGVINYGLLLNQHPDTQKANEALQAEVEQDKKEFDAKAPNLSDKEKQDLDMQLRQRVEQKRRELLMPIITSINDAVKAVADAKGLAIVVDKNSVIYGGQDITDEVMKKITGK